jgi:hypothetical protein
MSHPPLAGFSRAQTEITNTLARRIWDPRLRRGCASKIAGVLNQEFGLDPAAFPDGAQAAKELESRGITFPNLPLSEDRLESIRDHFRRRRPQAHAHERYHHNVVDVVEAPHLLELALSDQVLAPLAHYFGTVPFLSSVQSWWLESGSPLDGDQMPHRDQIDIWFCKLFIYLTDVTMEDAPHQFFLGSHDYAAVKKKLVRTGVPQAQLPTALRYVFEANFDTIQLDLLELFRDDSLTILGKAGTSFLADTNALHRGGVPAPGHTRLVFCAVYSLNLDPVFYDDMARLRALADWRDRVGPSPLARHAMRPWT